MATETMSYENPFTYTAAGELGVNRETMLQNELLLRTEVGKPKRRGLIFPSGSIYGRPNGEKDGGSSEALHGWPSLATTTLPFKQQKNAASKRDFMALNRAAITAGLVTANDQFEFRATHDIQRKVQSGDTQRVRTRRLPPSMVYGMSTRVAGDIRGIEHRDTFLKKHEATTIQLAGFIKISLSPSTPIFDLLEHKYQDQWLEERRKLELAKRQAETKIGRIHSAGILGDLQKRSTGQVYETRASLLRTYQNPVQPDPLWQMPKFTKEARPCIQSFRSAKAKQTAFSNFDSDKVARKGNLGHGVYESAQK